MPPNNFQPTYFGSVLSTRGTSSNGNDMGKSENSSSSSHELNNSSVKHYSNVKMKYFQSLGVDTNNSQNGTTKRERTITSPPLLDQINQLKEEEVESQRGGSPTKRRSISSPAPVLLHRISPPTAIPVPNKRPSRASDESDSDEENGKVKIRKKKRNKKSFECICKRCTVLCNDFILKVNLVAFFCNLRKKQIKIIEMNFSCRNSQCNAFFFRN